MPGRKEQKQAVRRRALEILIRESGNQGALADKAETKAAVISQMRSGHRAITDAMADRLEKGRRKPSGWMDHHEDGKADKPLIAQQQFLDEDLAILKRLLALPDEMQEAFRALIASAYSVTHQPVGRRTARQRAEIVDDK